MKKIRKVILIAGLLTSAYLLGTCQAKTETITEIKKVEKVIEVVPEGCIDTTTEEFCNNYVDMEQVTDFKATENGLQLYLNDGTGYFWERQEEAAMQKAIYIKTCEGIEVFDNTFNAEDRVLSMDYLESRHKRLRKRSKHKRKNPLWKLACFCGII